MILYVSVDGPFIWWTWISNRVLCAKPKYGLPFAYAVTGICLAYTRDNSTYSTFAFRTVFCYLCNIIASFIRLCTNELLRLYFVLQHEFWNKMNILVSTREWQKSVHGRKWYHSQQVAMWHSRISCEACSGDSQVITKQCWYIPQYMETCTSTNILQWKTVQTVILQKLQYNDY